MSAFFLIFALFLPRFALLGFYLFGTMPPNDTSFALDVAGSVFAPRLLIAWWTYANGEHPLWTVLFVAGWLLSAFGSRAGSTSRKESPRRERARV